MTDDTEEEEEDEGAQPVYPSRGPNKEAMTGEYLPDSDDWVAKSILDLNDPAHISALLQMGDMYPEVDKLQDFIDETVDVFLKAQTSVGGQSREEYRLMIESMHGKTSSDKDGANVVMELMGADNDD